MIIFITASLSTVSSLIVALKFLISEDFETLLFAIAQVAEIWNRSWILSLYHWFDFMQANYPYLRSVSKYIRNSKRVSEL